MNPQDRQFGYSEFISEIASLVAETEERPQTFPYFWADPEFRRWKHSVDDLIKRIEARGYVINCRVAQRLFGQGERAGSIRNSKFERDFYDTLVELETLVSHFEKYGAPSTAPSAAATENIPPSLPTPPSPQILTLAWLWNSMPAAWIVSIGVAAVALVSFGVWIGQSVMFAELVRRSDAQMGPGAMALPTSSALSRAAAASPSPRPTLLPTATAVPGKSAPAGPITGPRTN